MFSPVADHLLDWYKENARKLPWRECSDPYAIWVSEVMLQQTRVETVIPYFERWMERFPEIASLAVADQSEVLNLWEGLGYYSRARNLHRAAKVVVEEYGGILPADIRALRRLPGIGRYTAAAIASIAFGLDEAALDGNIRRVLSRVFDVDEPDRSADGERRLWSLAKQHLPAGRAGEFNQALMDMGATVCTAKSPDCSKCPIREFCQAYALGIQDQRPVRQAKPKPPHYQVTAAVISRDGKIFIARRPQHGLLAGMWEFPGGKVHQGEGLRECLQRELMEELAVKVRVGEPVGVYEHAYTHFSITLHAFECRLGNGSEPQALEHSEFAWVEPGELIDYPMGKVDRQIASRIAQEVQ